MTDHRAPLPAPLARLEQRAIGGLSAIERHHAACAMVEGALRLAVVARLVAWWQLRSDRPHLLDSLVVRLPEASLTPWVEALSMLEDLDGVPPSLQGQLRGFSPDPEPLIALRRAASSQADLSRRLPPPGEDALAGLALLVAYREAVVGRGDWYPDPFYERMGPLVLAAARAVLRTGGAWGGGELRILGRGTEGHPEATLQLVLPDEEVLLWPWLQVRRSLGSSGLVVDVDWERQATWSLEQAEAEGGALTIGWSDALAVQDLGHRWRVHALRLLDPLDGAEWEDEDPDALSLVSRMLDQARAGARTLAGTPVPPSRIEGRVASPRQLGTYQLHERLGRGATGAVYRARQQATDRLVAIKVLASELEDEDTARERFRRESRALSKADHPALVKVLDWGETDGRAWLAMEFVDGVDVSQLFRVLGPWQLAASPEPLCEGHLTAALKLPPRRSRIGEPPALQGGRTLAAALAERFAEVADGLQHLHDRGILHRDVKASNLRLADGGRRMVLLDFGLARLSEQSHSLTGTDHVIGTLRYMPPEQLCREELDGRVDTYSLGVTLWELVSGERFFDGRTEERLLHQVLNEQPPTLTRQAPWVEPELQDILRRATAKDRRDRYLRAEDLARDLRRYSRGESVRVARPPLRRRLRRLVRGRSVPLLAAAALGLGLGWLCWSWDQQRIKTSWTAHLDEVNGGLRAAGTVEEGGFGALRVERRGGRVERVSWTAPPQLLLEGTAPPAGAVSVHLDYDDQGRPIRHQWRDAAGATVRSMLVERVGEQGTLRLRHLSRLGVPMRPPGGAFVEDLRVDGAGRAVEKRWLDAAAQEPVPDAQGWFGMRYERDALGRVVRETGLDRDGAPASGRSGVVFAELRYEDDAHPWLPSERRTFDIDGEPVPGRRGAHVEHFSYDRFGQLIELAALDEARKPVRMAPGPAWSGQDEPWPMLSSGCAVVRTSRDDQGRPVAQRCLAEDGKPTFSARGIASWTVEWGPERAVWRWQDPQQHPLSLERWGAGVAAVTDRWGELAAATLLDETDSPTVGADGWVAMHVERDERGFPTATRWVDGAGAAALTRSGYAELRMAWTAGGLLTRTSYLDDAGQPTPGPEGAWSLERTYDSQGYLVQERALDAGGDPTWPRSGAPVVRYTRSAGGLPLETARYGLRGEPVIAEDGWHRVVEERDLRGAVVSSTVYGIDGRPTRTVEGFSSIRRTLDRFGEQTEARFFDEEGQPTPDEHGHARVVMLRDARGRLARVEHYDAADEPMELIDGVHARTYTYDALGQKLSEAIFDKDGKPTEQGGPQGRWYHRFAYSYDGRGSETSRSAWGLDGRLSDRGNFSIQRSIHDRAGNLVRMDFVGADGESLVLIPYWDVATIAHTYNGRNQVTETRYLGIDGETLAPADTALATYTYDERGRFTSESFYGVDGEPVAGRPLEWAEMDLDPELPDFTAPYHRREMAWSSTGELIEELLFGPDGAPCSNEYGVHRVVIERDQRGAEVSRAHYGVEGEPVSGPEGAHRLRIERDVRGQEMGWSYHDANDALVVGAGGFARRLFQRDDQQRVVEEWLFDVAGAPVRGTAGYAGARFEHDAYGRITGWSYFDEAGRPARTRAGFQRRVVTYGPSGRILTDERY